MDRGAQRATFHLVTESRTRLKQFSPRAHSESRRPECVYGGGGEVPVCTHMYTHILTHTWASQSITEGVQALAALMPQGSKCI